MPDGPSVTGLFIVAKTDFDKYKGSFENAVKKYTSKGIQELFGATRLKDVPAKAFGEATKAVLEAAPLMPVVSQFVGFVFGRFVDKAVDTVNNKILAHEIDNLKGMGVDPALITAIQGNQNLNLRFVIHAAKIPSLYEEVDGLIKETTSQILEIKKKQVNPKNPVAPKDLEQLFRLL